MHQDIARVLLTEDQIKARVRELGAELMRDYEDKNPVFVGVLKGVVVFYADMIRAFDAPCQLDMTESADRDKRERLDRAVDGLRERFGDTCIRRAILLEDPDLTGFSPYDDHTVHPVGFSGKTDKIGGNT